MFVFKLSKYTIVITKMTIKQSRYRWNYKILYKNIAEIKGEINEIWQFIFFYFLRGNLVKFDIFFVREDTNIDKNYKNDKNYKFFLY